MRPSIRTTSAYPIPPFLYQLCQVDEGRDCWIEANRSRYNGLWTKDVQNVIFAILLCGWLGGLNVEGKENKEGTLLSIEEVGQFVGGKFLLSTPQSASPPAPKLTHKFTS